jgi:Zn-dependent peptidase ImmA (M78 family)
MKARLLFTALHECGHWFLHQRYYYDCQSGETLAACRRSEIENCGQRKLTTAHDFLEHQANVFAGAIAMPTVPLRFAVDGLCDSLGIRKRYDMNNFMLKGENITFYHLLGFHISDTFGVSQKAARIRLYKQGYIQNASDAAADFVSA